jgi:DisA bacterial checkpoint controller nucleotide-binding
MIENSIIRQILDGWAAAENHPFGDRTQRPLPSFHDVKEVFEQVFLASLKCEEGRPIRCSIVLASPSDIDDPSHRYNKDFRRFATPLPLTAESIAKLAPAFDPMLSSIAVCRDSATRTLQCWGIFNYSPPAHRFNEPSPAVVEGMWFRPDLFTLTTRNPGSVQVSRMNSSIGWFTDGDFVPAVPTPFTSKSLGNHLIEPLKSTNLWQKYGTYYWHYYSAALEVLLFESASRGHGAIIILLASGNTVIPEHVISDAYRLEAVMPLQTHLENLLEAQRLHQSSDGKLLLEHLQRLAQLSTVDGALILTRELELVAFGAKLHVPNKWTGKTLEGPDGFGYTSRNPFAAQRYGVRHNSAINFAAECEGSTVFVISQDGPIRAFIRFNEDTVLYWPDCTVSMFV